MARAKPPAPQQTSLWSPKELSGLSRQFNPPPIATQGSRGYQAAQGKTFNTRGLGNLQADPQRGYATYQAYRQGMSAPQHPAIASSYKAMAEHVNRQYEYMTKPEAEGGMGLRHEVTPHDPYANPQAMAEDITKNRRIQTFASASTGPHEYFSPEENDRFRAVHDVFGHAAIGRGFSRHGEEAAYRAHRQMFPPEAQHALASETRGQNAFLIYSPENSFPSQEGKLIGLPEFATQTGQLRTSRKKIRNKGARQLNLF